MKPRMLLGAAVLFMACALLLQSCAVKGPVKQEPPIKIGILGCPYNLNPLLPREACGDEIVNVMFRGLVDWNEKWELFPLMAKEVPSPEAGTVVRRGRSSMAMEFAIDGRARWSNGLFLEAPDFIFFYQMAVFPGLRGANDSWARSVDKVKSLGEDRVEVSWKSLDAGSMKYLKAFPRELLEAKIYENAQEFFKEPYRYELICNGPYVAANVKLERERITSLSLLRNDEYGRKKAALSRFDVKFFPSRDAFESDLFGGAFDIMPSLTYSEGKMLSENEKFSVYFTPGSSVVTLFFDMESPLLEEKELRKALLLSLNREELVKNVYEKGGKPAQSWLAERHPAYVSAFSGYQYSQKSALEALNAIGWKRDASGTWKSGNKALTLRLYYADESLFATVAATVKKEWEALGITVSEEKVRSENFFTTLAQYRKNAYPSVILSSLEAPPWVSPGTYFGSKPIDTVRDYSAKSHFSRWNSKENEELCKAFSEELDTRKRNEMLRSHQVLVAEELPLVPLFSALKVSAVRKGFKNFNPRGFGDNLWNIEYWEREGPR
ncbi:MAG: ABC transporter substrate-binding protein [Candidatus Eremiobacteraeota bacterium]|nr:ABC transporter substrate-binding protein [Candidatus Eremiobacteraeota bacterium]